MNATAIKNAAAIIADLERRNDFGGLHRQAMQNFDEAGGFAGYSPRGKMLYYRADGRLVLDKAVALESWK